MSGEENKKIRDVKEDKLAGALDAILKTEEGRTVIKYLFDISGYNKTSIAGDRRNGDVLTNATIYNEARREIYIRLRGWASPELLGPVEMAAELERLSPSADAVPKSKWQKPEQPKRPWNQRES